MSEFKKTSKITINLHTAHHGRSGTVRQIFGIGNDSVILTILESSHVPMSGITYITGISGAGKSTLLRCIAEIREDAKLLPQDIDPNLPVIDLLDTSVPEAIRWMSSFGLGEARLMVTPFSQLSDGQKVRACLAMLLWQKPKCIIVDEFLSVLDRLTARIVANQLQKICRKNGITAYLATTHEDLAVALAPDNWIEVEFGGESHLRVNPISSPHVEELSEVKFENGTASDYRSLGRYHYIEHLASEAPLSELEWDQTVCQVRVARYRGRVVAAAVFSRPVPRLFEKIPFFATLNRHAIVVLRVIVHPLFRGVGLTKRLLMPELHVDTRCLLACSALGLYFPFFLGAEFERIPHPRNFRYPEHDELESELFCLSDDEMHRINNYEFAQKFYNRLSDERKVKLRRVASKICTRSNVDYCLFTAKSIKMLENEEEQRRLLNRFFQDIIEHVPEEEFGTLLSEALYFPVQGFIKQIGSC